MVNTFLSLTDDNVLTSVIQSTFEQYVTEQMDMNTTSIMTTTYNNTGYLGNIYEDESDKTSTRTIIMCAGISVAFTLVFIICIAFKCHSEKRQRKFKTQ